jgi:hypothetical protein
MHRCAAHDCTVAAHTQHTAYSSGAVMQQLLCLQTLTLLSHTYCVPRLTDASDADTTVKATLNWSYTPHRAQCELPCLLTANKRYLH